MKTRSVDHVSIESSGKVKSFEEKKPAVPGVRRLLQPLQESATDKENLVSAGSGRLMSPRKEKHVKSVHPKQPTPSKSHVKKNVDSKKVITAEDLTTEATPSIAYYELLCEKQRQALEDALKENQRLHNRVQFLEQENEQIKIVLEETKNLVQTLTDIINEDDEE